MSTIVSLFYASSIETGGTNALTGKHGIKGDSSAGLMIEPAVWASGHGTYNVGDLVSSAGIAYSCNTSHSAGVSLAADAAKWDSLGSCSLPQVASVGTVYTLYYRAIDSVTGDDPQQDSIGSIVFTPSADMQVCATYNGSFTSSPLTLGTVTGGNKPIYAKQVNNASSSTEQMGVGQLVWTTPTRVGQVGVVSTSYTSSTVTLTWSAVSGATSYEIDRSTTSNFLTNLVHISTNASSGYINNSANGNAPSVGQQYYYRVRAYDNNGAGLWSNGVGVLIPSDLTAPSTIADLVATANSGSGKVDLTWTKPTDVDDTQTVLLYDILWKTTNATPAAGDTPNVTGQTNIATYQVTGLTNLTPYYFWVRAVDPYGNKAVWSNVDSAVPTSAIWSTDLTEDFNNLTTNSWTYDVGVSILSGRVVCNTSLKEAYRTLTGVGGGGWNSGTAKKRFTFTHYQQHAFPGSSGFDGSGRVFYTDVGSGVKSTVYASDHGVSYNLSDTLSEYDGLTDSLSFTLLNPLAQGHTAEVTFQYSGNNKCIYWAKDLATKTIAIALENTITPATINNIQIEWSVASSTATSFNVDKLVLQTGA